MGRELWAAREELAAPQSRHTKVLVDFECKRWNLEHAVLDLLSHFTMGKIQW